MTTESWEGRFHPSGVPLLRISIQGLSRLPLFVEAIIDTGFDGLLMVPFSFVDIPKPPITDLKSITLANGHRFIRLVAEVTVSVGEENRTEEILLEPDGKDVIVGMEFLTIFGRGLIIMPSQDIVTLPIDDTID